MYGAEFLDFIVGDHVYHVSQEWDGAAIRDEVLYQVWWAQWYWEGGMVRKEDCIFFLLKISCLRDFPGGPVGTILCHSAWEACAWSQAGN